jgi:hypothetical protein
MNNMEFFDNDDKAFIERFISYIKDRKKDYYGFEIDRNVVEKMTIEYMEALMKKYSEINNDKTFIEGYVRKKFYSELNRKELEDLNIRRTDLKTLFKYAKTLSADFDNLKSQILYEILDNGMKLCKKIFITSRNL